MSKSRSTSDPLKILSIFFLFALLQPASATSGNDADLSDLSRELERLRARFTDNHPDVKSLLRKIETIESTPNNKAEPTLSQPARPIFRQAIPFKAGKLSPQPIEDLDDENDQGVLRQTGFVPIPDDTVPSPGPFWPTVVDVRGFGDFPFDYALYFSTDHHGNKGGIWLYLCNGDPSQPTNWISYDQALSEGAFDYLPHRPRRNPIFIDRVQGRQTETPHVNWVSESELYLTYHNLQAGHAQSTLLATSKDGVNFRRINGKEDSVILDYNPAVEPGDGHTGYFRWGRNPFPKLPYSFVGYSLHGGRGGKGSYSAMWGSLDAIAWEKIVVLAKPVSLESRKSVGWNIDPNSIRKLADGRYVGITSFGFLPSNAHVQKRELYEVFLSETGKRITGLRRKLIGTTGLADNEEEILSQPTVLELDGIFIVFFVSKAESRTNRIGIGTLVLDHASK